MVIFMTLAETETPSPRTEARRRAILDVARELFLVQGFAATSMSEIAGRLGGSKGTLYNYFRSKEELFAAFMTDTCGDLAYGVYARLPPVGADIRDALIELGEGLLKFLLRDDTMAIQRLVVAEAGRFPELGKVFYETGPRKNEERMANYLRAAMDAGQIRDGDAMQAGRWLRDLILSDILTKRMWGVVDDLGSARVRAHCAEAAEIFLTAFGAASSGM